MILINALHIHLQRGDERLLRNVDLAELPHAFFALLLLVERFALAPLSTPAGLVGGRRAQKLLDVGLDQAESDIAVKLLAPFIENKARAALNSHFVGSLVIRRQTGERDTTVDASFNGGDIGAERFGNLALGIPASNVPTVCLLYTSDAADE